MTHPVPGDLTPEAQGRAEALLHYRTSVIESTACPLCGALVGLPCQDMQSAVGTDVPVPYVHDDRSAVHWWAKFWDTVTETTAEAESPWARGDLVWVASEEPRRVRTGTILDLLPGEQAVVRISDLFTGRTELVAQSSLWRRTPPEPKR